MRKTKWLRLIGRSLTIRALPALINELHKQGYRLVTLKELMAYQGD